jgi:hypothetical protein
MEHGLLSLHAEKRLVSLRIRRRMTTKTVSSLYLQRKRLVAVRRLARLTRRKEYEMVPLFTCRGRGW